MKILIEDLSTKQKEKGCQNCELYNYACVLCKSEEIINTFFDSKKCKQFTPKCNIIEFETKDPKAVKQFYDLYTKIRMDKYYGENND